MIDRTTLLFALPGFRVLDVTLEPDGGRLVLVESLAKDGGCPWCGVISSRVKDRPTCRLKDLPHGSVPLRLWVCKRRFLDGEALRLCEVLAVVVLDASVHLRLVHSADSRRPSWQVALTGHPTLTNASNATSWTPSTESIGAVQGSGLWGLRERSHFAGLLIWPDHPGLWSRLSRVIGASGWSGRLTDIGCNSRESLRVARCLRVRHHPRGRTRDDAAITAQQFAVIECGWPTARP